MKKFSPCTLSQNFLCYLINYIIEQCIILFTKKAYFASIGSVQNALPYFWDKQDWLRTFLEYIMKKALINIAFFVVLPVLCSVKAEAKTSGIDYEERFPQLKEQIIRGSYNDALGALKQIILDDELSHAEKYDLLEKNYYLFKNLGKYTEAGEILEFNYLVNPQDEEVLAKVHAELTRFYRTIRKWSKSIEAHFYYIEHVKLKSEQLRAVLFDIVDDYQRNRDYIKANQVLEEVFSLCETKDDFAWLYYYQAQSSFNQNNYPNAIELFRKALAQEALPDYEKVVALYQLGFCYEIVHKKEEALAAYELALPLSQNSLVIENRINKLQGKK